MALVLHCPMPMWWKSVRDVRCNANIRERKQDSVREKYICHGSCLAKTMTWQKVCAMLDCNAQILENQGNHGFCDEQVTEALIPNFFDGSITNGVRGRKSG